MSFLSTEISALLGSPIEFYEFNVNGATSRFTSARKAQVTAGDVVWTPRAIKRGKIEQNKEYTRSALMLNVARDFPVAAQFVASPPEGVSTLTIYRKHLTDPEIAAYWKGRIVGVSFSGSTATIKCDPAYTGMQSAGRRATYSVNCRHSLYHENCGVVRADFTIAGVIEASSGVLLTSPAFAEKPSGWLNGGTIALTIEGVLVRRLIIEHSGNTIRLMGKVYGLTVGATFEAYSGCPKDFATCSSKFNNAINFGGFPWKPTKNPFSGDSIY